MLKLAHKVQSKKSTMEAGGFGGGAAAAWRQTLTTLVNIVKLLFNPYNLEKHYMWLIILQNKYSYWY